MSLKTYIDYRSYEEHVAEAVPTGAYDLKAREILLDGKNNWQLNYYNKKFVGYENEIYYLEKNISDINDENQKYKLKIDNLREEIDNENKSNEKDSNEKESIEKKSIKNQRLNQINNEKIEKLIENIYDNDNIIKNIQVKLEKLKYNYSISESEYYNLKRARREYIQTHDLEYLRKAVHYICSYADMLRYGSKYKAPYYNHPLEYKDSPFNIERTNIMNQIAYEDPSKIFDLEIW
jgi:predicted RNase H-like nuclease (RuvC/YqgF family)